MATAQSIIDAAFRKIGHSDPTDTDRTNALENLNNMVSAWGIEFLNYYVVRESLALTIGDAEYTIGSAGDLNTVRPVALLDCYLRNSDGYDHPLNVISIQDYGLVSPKTYEGKPLQVYFIPEYPLAKVIFDAEPNVAYTAYFTFEKNLTEFTTIATTVSLPNEYKEALVYNLAISLAEDKGIAVRDSVAKTAQRMKDLILRVNAINRPVAEAQFDFEDQSAFDISTGE